MVLPNFLIIGAQKCGTTSLHDILNKHPQANMSKVKEIRFFLDPKYNKGLQYYSTYFEKPNHNQIVTGESSPGYICNPEVPKRIKNDLGSDVKLVLILRDPIKRAFSHYWHSRRNLKQHLSEAQIVEKYLFEDYKSEERGYFSRGIYIKYIYDYLEYFDRKNLHIIILEDLIKNQKDELRSLYRFLNINDSKGLQKLPKTSNASVIWNNPLYLLFFNKPHLQKYLPKRGKGLLFFGKQEPYKYKLPNDEILSRLKNFYKPYNKELSEFLGKSLDNWM